MPTLQTHTLGLSPSDVLFFKDGRPMDGAQSGHGASWPMPHVLDSALHHALRRANLSDIHDHTSKRSGKELNPERKTFFGSLQSAGPFPVVEGTWHFPRPADADLAESSLTTHRPLVENLPGSSNSLNRKLSPVVNSQAPSKESAEPWMSKEAYEAYLKGAKNHCPSKEHFLKNESIYAAEHNIGIGIDASTGAQDGKSFYSASYLRLKPGVQLGMVAKCWDKGASGEQAQHDLIAQCFPQNTHHTHILAGGQQRACTVERSTQDQLPLPMGPEIQSKLVRWTLLTPAIFPKLDETHSHSGGWLPSWINEDDFSVQLKDPTKSQRNGRGRQTWRKAVAALPRIKAKLVAASIPRAIPVTGWAIGHGDQEFGAKATHLAVPAGAVYFFEADDETAAKELANALNWHGLGDGTEIQNRRSSIFGEKGYGLGVCSNWQAHTPTK